MPAAGNREVIKIISSKRLNITQTRSQMPRSPKKRPALVGINAAVRAMKSRFAKLWSHKFFCRIPPFSTYCIRRYTPCPPPVSTRQPPPLRYSSHRHRPYLQLPPLPQITLPLPPHPIHIFSSSPYPPLIRTSSPFRFCFLSQPRHATIIP